MKYKILVIFFMSIILSIAIYFININNNKKIVILGDDFLISKNNSYDSYFKYNSNISNVNKLFVSDNKNYKEILSDIKNNNYIISKGNKIYLNQVISDSDYIILNANNSEYLNKCKKGINIISNYNNVIKEDLYNLIEVINKISQGKIIIISNFCLYNQESFIENKNYNVIDIYNKPFTKKYINNNRITESGSYYLYNQINKYFN